MAFVSHIQSWTENITTVHSCSPLLTLITFVVVSWQGDVCFLHLSPIITFTKTANFHGSLFKDLINLIYSFLIFFHNTDWVTSILPCKIWKDCTGILRHYWEICIVLPMSPWYAYPQVVDGRKGLYIQWTLNFPG